MGEYNYYRRNIMKFPFLKSTRFWVMIVGAVAVYLKMKGLIGEPEMQLIATLSATFIAVRTIDKFNE